MVSATASRRAEPASPAGRPIMKADVKKPRPASPWRTRLAPALTWLRTAQRFLIHQGFSSISRRIVLLNLAGLLALVSGILYLSQFRAGLIDARIQSMVIKGEIIAGAIAGSPSGEPQITTLDRERLLELQAGESYGPDDPAALEFPINPERIAPIPRRPVTPVPAPALPPRRTPALQSAAAGGEAELPAPPVELHRAAPVAHGSAALPGARVRQRQGVSRGGAGHRRAERERGAGERAPRGDRIGGGSGAA